MCKLLKLNLFNSPKSSLSAFIILLLLGFILYGNTLSHDYALDDSIVIKQNDYTKQGISGLKTIFTKDTFFGFFNIEGKDKLVAGGRYRPMSLAFFAVAWSVWGDSPLLFHLSNILFYSICCFLIFYLLSRLSATKDLMSEWFPLLVAGLFMVNPIHTEVVANIKGLDEIFSLTGSMLAAILIIKAIDKNILRNYLLAALSFFFALMSKENAISFVAIIPLSLYLLHKQSIKDSIIKSWPLWLSVFAFLSIRTSILGWDLGGEPMELMNNPFLKIVDNVFVPYGFSEKMASIIFCLGYYLKLFIIPHPLTHDYYPMFVELKSFSSLSVIISLLAHLLLIIIAAINLKKRSILSYGIFYYFITLSIVSNIVFPVGTNMAERFLFMPSLGICMIVAFGIHKLTARRNIKIGIAAVILLLHSGLTIARNPVWKNDFTLFTTDVKTSHNSAKANNAAGGAIQTEALKLTDAKKKNEMFRQSNVYLRKAVKIHPNYKNAYLLMGNNHFYLKDYNAAVQSYEFALRIDPNYTDAMNNLSISFRELGKREGEKNNNIGGAINYLNKSFQLNNSDPETVRLLGVAHGMSNNHSSAVQYFEKLTQMIPDSAFAYVVLFKACKNAGMEEKALSAYEKAIQLDPKAFKN